MTRFALTIEFDGGPFVGLQRQTSGPSVQQAIEEAAQRVTGEQVTLHSAGRTDSGVHALAMRSHVEIAKPFDPVRLREALNAHLRPAPIAITHCEVKPDDWHARFSCIGRSYEYRIRNRRAPLTLEKGRAWHVARPLDAGAMHEAAQSLVGLHDFTTFRSAHCQSASPLKTLDRLDVSREGDAVIIQRGGAQFPASPGALHGRHLGDGRAGPMAGRAGGRGAGGEGSCRARAECPAAGFVFRRRALW